jgi:hypothetical protein
MAARGKAVSGALDFLGLSTKKAGAYIDRGGKKATRSLVKRGAAYDKGVASGSIKVPGFAPLADQKRAETIRSAAIMNRQMRVGGRYAAGGAALGGVGMYKNKTGSRGGYHGPNMQPPRGSGRFA